MAGIDIDFNISFTIDIDFYISFDIGIELLDFDIGIGIGIK